MVGQIKEWSVALPVAGTRWISTVVLGRMIDRLEMLGPTKGWDAAVVEQRKGARAPWQKPL